ncbi:MAG TPA: S4 domain-containing protein [Rhodoferax sp.]|nr:S4 domain-containing protein [Rhodoferax sp.]HQY76803.1 S4 domain-containing protein [Rhodoferax sp.]
MEKIRIDKWLWAARFFKTRSLATDEVQRGRVQMEQRDIKPSREVQVGDTVTLWQGQVQRTVVVKGISGQRGSAPVAQQLYDETAESLTKRAQEAERRRLSPEPAASIEHGRPTKRDRRNLEKGWNDRWSASLD